MNETEALKQAYDVVIHMNEPRYWYFMLGSILAGFVVVQAFQKLTGASKERALRNMGFFMIFVSLVPPLYGMLNPDGVPAQRRNSLRIDSSQCPRSSPKKFKLSRTALRS